MAKGNYPHILIIGGGMSGLMLAHQLKQHDVSFSVYERDSDSYSRSKGWALSLFGPALAEIEKTMVPELGPVEQASHLTPLELPAQFVFYDITRPEMRVGVTSDDSGKIIRCNRQRLKDWLLQGLDINFGKRLVKVEEGADEITVHFEDGTSAKGDILIGCEGTRSTVRQHILKGKDVMKPLPLGSLVGEVELSGDALARQLSLAHSGHIIMDSTLTSENQCAVFAALNKISDDGTSGSYYFILLWVDGNAPNTTDEKPVWNVGASKEQLAAFAREKTRSYPAHLRELIDSVPVGGYGSPGFQLQGVQMKAEQLPAGRIMVIGDAAHSMTPFRGEAGVCAFMDAIKLGQTLAQVKETSAKGPDLERLMAEFRDDMIKRGDWAIEVSNPVLEDYVANTHRSSNGCWTCRLRRKKCDEKHPVCDGCDALNIACYYGHEKPLWMDGGARQAEMAEYLKRKVKERGHRRFVNHNTNNANAAADAVPALTQTRKRLSLGTLDTRSAVSAVSGPDTESPSNTLDADSPRRSNCKLAPPVVRRDSAAQGQFDDTVLIMFYIEHVVPFLFPFYQPPLLQGGKAWILDMMTNSPVVRRAALCQSSYFFSMSRGAAHHGDPPWEATVLAQAREAFAVLRQALQVISSSNIAQHLHGAVRVLSGIIQVQRFDIAISSFENCRSHLNAALALFTQVLDSATPTETLRFHSSFEAVMYKLSPATWSHALNLQLPSAEQAAFRFSSALLIFDDIIASTVLQEQPRLYELHNSLLSDVYGTGPAIDLEAVVGCQNWALVQIAKIAALDAWKQRCNNTNTLDVMELVHRATQIKASLEIQLAVVQTGAETNPNEKDSVFDLFSTKDGAMVKQKPLVTLAWAHAALIYLFVVVSGWQPANAEIRHHVMQIIEGSACRITPPALLRTMIWPLSVAGCLAEAGPANQLCSILESLQPRSVFGTVTKALEMMKNVWSNSNPEGITSRDLAYCFRIQGDMVLLV